MDSAVISTLISTSGAVLVGLGGMWISTNQIGKRIETIERRLEVIQADWKEFYKTQSDMEHKIAKLEKP